MGWLEKEWPVPSCHRSDAREAARIVNNLLLKIFLASCHLVAEDKYHVRHA